MQTTLGRQALSANHLGGGGRQSWQREIFRWAAWSIALLLWLILFLTTRFHFQGPFDEVPLSSSVLLFGIFVAGLAFAGHGAFRLSRHPSQGNLTAEHLVHGVVTLPLFLAGISGYFSESWRSGLPFALPVLLGEGIFWGYFWWTERPFLLLRRNASFDEEKATMDEEPSRSSGFACPSPVAALSEEMEGGLVDGDFLEVEMELEEETDLFGQDANLLQQLTRSRLSDEIEHIDGCLRATFASHEKMLSLHVAFCPPFARIPEVQAEQLDGPECRINVVQCQPYGARFDVKLSQDAGEGERSVQIIFFAEGPVLDVEC